MNRVNPAPPRALRLRSPRLRLATLGLLLLALIPGLRAATEVARDFDVPAGQARDTLKRFAAQAQVEIVFPSENTLGVATNAIRGRFSPEEAMGALLAGTSLTATRDPKTGA
jgi:iron complex outermembrane receptor protein